MKRRTLGAVARKRALRIGALAMLAALALPSSAFADTFTPPGKLASSVGINSTWVIVAGCFVMFMQAGFAFLEIGFSRGKNAGTVIAKILTNFSIAAIMYWAIGFAFAFGNGKIIGDAGPGAAARRGRRWRRSGGRPSIRRSPACRC